MNMSKLCPKCQYFVGAPLLSSTALILMGMEFTRAAQVVAVILFHSINNDITELLDVRHMVLLHLPLEDAPYVLNRFQVWIQVSCLATPSPSPSAVSQLSSWLCFWGGCYDGKQFLKGGHHLLFQNVTVHVGIHVSLNEPQLLSTSSFRRGFLLGRRPCKPTCCTVWRMV